MAFLKKNFFWIANFLLTAAMVGVWFYATGAITTATEARESTIRSKLSSATAVQNVRAEEEGDKAHPNQTTEDGMKVKLDTLADSITRAWTTRYESQREIMTWPKSILFGDAGRRFIEEFDKYDPPETMPAEFTGDSEQMKRLLRVYKQQIPSQMQYICSIIKSDWRYQDLLNSATLQDESDNSEAGDDAADADSTAELEKGTQSLNSGRQIVTWNEINQQLWYNKLRSFRGRDDNEFSVDLPTPSQVYMLQQDLWLLEAMFQIIREVNAEKDSDGNILRDADGNAVMVAANDLATIKKIDHVVFGREALSLLGKITDTIKVATQKKAGRRGGRGARGKSSASSDESFAYRGQPAFHGRYVNANLEPIEADKIRKVLTGEKLPDDNLEVVVAKRVPVRLAVQMDERKIIDFLVACANSPFAFEVWQVRINRHDSEEVIKLRGGEGAARGPAKTRGGRDEGTIGQLGTGGGGGGTAGVQDARGGGGGGAGADAIAVRSNFDVGVEFYGIVKIYNPVNEACLGRKADDAAQP